MVVGTPVLIGLFTRIGMLGVVVMVGRGRVGVVTGLREDVGLGRDGVALVICLLGVEMGRDGVGLEIILLLR